MTARRPVVIVSGKNRQLPVGDTLLGVPVYLPVYLQSGSMLNIPINSSTTTLSVNLQTGGSLNVGVAING